MNNVLEAPAALQGVSNTLNYRGTMGSGGTSGSRLLNALEAPRFQAVFFSPVTPKSSRDFFFFYFTGTFDVSRANMRLLSLGSSKFSRPFFRNFHGQLGKVKAT